MPLRRGELVYERYFNGFARDSIGTSFSVAKSVVSALVGIAIATGASYGLSGLMGVPYTFDASINLLALVFSAFIGVVFGYFPARRAARMDPIEALRHE